MVEALPWDWRQPGAIAAYQPGMVKVTDYVPGQAPDSYYMPKSVMADYEPPAGQPAPVDRGMLVTLITDASVHEGVGAWAAFARSKRATMPVTAGRLKMDGVRSSMAAEFLAFVNGLHLAIARGVAKPGDTILAQIDNKGAIHIVSQLNNQTFKVYRKTVNRDAIADAMKHCRSLIKDNRLSIKTRHIKAHSGTADPRRFIHDQCDRAASRARKGY